MKNKTLRLILLIAGFALAIELVVTAVLCLLQPAEPAEAAPEAHLSTAETLPEPEPEALPEPARCPVTVPASSAEKSGDVVIVADLREGDTQLAAMIDRFRAQLSRKTRVVNIREYPFRGGCLGCFNCAVSGKCIYKDGFDEYLRNEIQRADSIVYAFTISDHSMGARFKMYDDRQFCNGHRTVTIGMPVGYLISGNYSREMNLQTIVEARAQVVSNFLAGVATDEHNTDAAIDTLCATLTYVWTTDTCPLRISTVSAA